MTKTYGDKHEKLVATTISPKAAAAIGRLVRAFAEVEDLISLHISRLAQTTEGMAAIFLGRLPISAKVTMAEYMAKLHGKKMSVLHTTIFNESFREALTCRNAVAHGVLLGKTRQTRRLAFLTSTTLDPTNSNLVREAVSYSTGDIAAYAYMTLESIPKIERLLGLGSLREKRLRQSLRPHRKSQSKGSARTKLRPRPKPSPV